MYEIYTILNNETLDSIAQKYNTTINTLYEINGFSDNYNPIPGNNIIVPANKQKPYKYYTVTKGDNVYKIAKDNNINYNLLLKINGLDEEDYIYPNQTILIPKDNYKYYLTKKEDNLRKVSDSFNTNPSNIIEKNPNLFLAPDQIIIFKEK